MASEVASGTRRPSRHEWWLPVVAIVLALYAVGALWNVAAAQPVGPSGGVAPATPGGGANVASAAGGAGVQPGNSGVAGSQGPSSATQPSDPRILLEYEKQLQEATRDHEAFVERLNGRLESDAVKLFSVALGIVGALVAWFEFQTRRSLRRSIAARVSATINDEVKAEIAEVMNGLRKDWVASANSQIAEAKSTFASSLAAIQEQVEGQEKTFRNSLELLEKQVDAQLLEELSIRDIVTRSLIELHEVDRRRLLNEKATDGDLVRILEVIKEVESALERHPGKRSLVIIRGRFYEEYECAPGVSIQFLQRNLEIRKELRVKHGQSDECNVDDAAILYNIACNAVELWQLHKQGKSAEDQAKAAEMRNLAEEAYSKSIAIDPSNKKEAAEDPGLKALIADMKD